LLEVLSPAHRIKLHRPQTSAIQAHHRILRSKSALPIL
jgi:hypothetical protein